jgi:hypothetical protein
VRRILRPGSDFYGRWYHESEEDNWMSRWYRIFGWSERQPSPEVILGHLHALGMTDLAQFHGDDAGWKSLEFTFTEGIPLVLECYLSSEPGIRAELNNWAAWVETCESSPRHAALMERIIQTRQLYTILSPDEESDSFCEELCRFLARATDGVYHGDGKGFLAADGTLLLEER